MKSQKRYRENFKKDLWAWYSEWSHEEIYEKIVNLEITISKMSLRFYVHLFMSLFYYGNFKTGLLVHVKMVDGNSC